VLHRVAGHAAGRRCEDAALLELRAHLPAPSLRGLHRERRLQPGLGGQQRLGADVCDPALLLKCAYDADDAAASFAAACKLRGEEGARMQADRLRETEPDLGLARAADVPALVERRRLVARVIPAERDELERLAQVE